MSSTKTLNGYVLFVAIVGSLGGLLFGLDQGLMNGALIAIKDALHLSTQQSALFASTMLYGAVVGAFFSGMLSSILGRKKTLLLTSFLFLIFAAISITTTSYTALSIYRFFIGFAVGVASFIVPLYLSEIAPKRQRGGFIALYQLMVTVGIMVIFVTNHFFTEYGGTWQQMFYPIILIALVMSILLIFIPNSPRWLFLVKQDKKAISALRKMRHKSSLVEEEINEIKSLVDNKSKLRDILSKGYYWKILLLGIGIQILQQLTGINAVIYYSSLIFSNAGFSNPTTATMIIGVVNVVSTIFAVYYIDKLGRKPIMYAGLVLMIIFLVITGVIFHIDGNLPYATELPQYLKNSVVISTILYVIAFAVSAGPICWIICAEIFPLEARDIGVSVTTITNWVFAGLVVNLSLPFMNYADGTPNLIGGSYIFFFFALCCALGLLLMYFFTPETKGVSLEAMEERLKSGVKIKHIGACKDNPQQ